MIASGEESLVARVWVISLCWTLLVDLEQSTNQHWLHIPGHLTYPSGIFSAISAPLWRQGHSVYTVHPSPACWWRDKLVNTCLVVILGPDIALQSLRNNLWDWPIFSSTHNLLVLFQSLVQIFVLYQTLIQICRHDAILIYSYLYFKQVIIHLLWILLEEYLLKSLWHTNRDLKASRHQDLDID